MKLLFTSIIMLFQWFYIPLESPSKPVEINSVNLNLKNDELALTFFMLSDGEAALFQHPNGESVLINTGGSETKKELINLLQLYHVKKLSKIILTSESRCCIESTKWLIEEYGVKQIITGSNLIGAITSSQFINQNTVAHLYIKAGMTHEVLPGLSMEVLDDKKGLNILFTFSEHQVIWLDALEHILEEYTKDESMEITAVKLPRSPGDGYVTEKLIEKLDPQMAFYFSDKDIGKSSELLEQLQHSWVHLYYNKNIGAISIKFMEDDYEVFNISDQEK